MKKQNLIDNELEEETAQFYNIHISIVKKFWSTSYVSWSQFVEGGETDNNTNMTQIVHETNRFHNIYIY